MSTDDNVTGISRERLEQALRTPDTDDYYNAATV